METHIKLAKDVFVDENLLYIIRIDREICAFSETEEAARKVVDLLIQDETKRQQATDPSGKNLKVFREDIKDGANVVTQKLGYLYNGAVTTVCTVDFIVIPHVYASCIPHPPPPPALEVPEVASIVEEKTLPAFCDEVVAVLPVPSEPVPSPPSEVENITRPTIDALEKVIRSLEATVVNSD